MDPNDPIHVRISDVKKSYGDHLVLRGVTFDVHRGLTNVVIGASLLPQKVTTVPASALSQGRRTMERRLICSSKPAGHAHAPSAMELPTRHLAVAPHQPSKSSTWNAPPKSLWSDVPVVVHLLGERPGTGLNTLSAYLTYGRDPRGQSRWTPALDHSCTTAVCGIHPRGKTPEVAAAEIVRLVGRMLERRCSGVLLAGAPA